MSAKKKTKKRTQARVAPTTPVERSLESLEASCLLAGPAADGWRKLIEAVPLQVETQVGGDAVPDAGTSALGEDNDGGWVFSANIHGVLPTNEPGQTAPGTRVHWHFRLRRAPKSPAPDWLKQASARVGGYPEVLKRISKAWPDEAPATFEVGANLPTGREAVRGHA